MISARLFCMYKYTMAGPFQGLIKLMAGAMREELGGWFRSSQVPNPYG